ncbi:MAG: translocation/assembly module TamB domain-containing protein [Armatimonadetes bacterium]|nr:translocation/assembly module TamB domain-containing protein [Armatimonadota bacterium]
MEPIVTVKDRQIDLLGEVFYKGLSGTLEGTVPFSSLFESDEERRPMKVDFVMIDRSFSSFAPYISSLDEEWSEGTVTGSATLTGLWGELSLVAELHAKGSALGFVGQETALTDVDFHLAMSDWKTDLTGSFKSSLGGSVEVDLHAESPDLFAGETTFAELPARTPLTGTIDLQEFAARFRILDANRTSRALLSTESLVVSGTVAEPEFTGGLAISDLYIRLPNELQYKTTAVVYAINPVFSGVVVSAAEGSEMDSGNAQIQFFGSGTINGSLQNPDLSFPLVVSGGVFRLPTARITLESGGSINIGYRSQLGTVPSASVVLNLEGRTTVSARSADNEYETYQVLLDIKGDLLSDDDLQIQASSDPPGLSSDQILAVLGQKDLLEGFALSGSQTGVRESIYSAAFPAAAGLITAEFARDLKLDYIALDYNPFDQAIAGIGKSLARGLMLHGRRQLSTQAGTRLKYEVQLTYRLPLEDAFFSRLRLGLGLDQDVPWRFRLNWARRF